MDLAPPGRAAAAATTYGVAARSPGCCAPRLGVSGVLSIRRRGAAAAPRGDRLFREWRPAPAAMELEDGPRAAGASGRGGDLRQRRPTGSRLDRRLLRTAVGGLRRALYPLTWVQRQRHAAILFFANGGQRRRRWSSRMDLEPPGRAAAAATYASGDLRGRGSIAGCCAQRLEVGRRGGKDRRSGVDARSDAEKKLIGERRSGVSRRSGTDRRLAAAKQDRR